MSVKSASEHQSSVKPAQQTIQNAIRDTILQVEQMLMNLPGEGTKVEVLTTTERTAPAGCRTTQDYVVPDTTDSEASLKAPVARPPSSSASSSSKKRPSSTKLISGKTDVVPGSVEVSKLTSDGCVVDLAVRVKRGTDIRVLKMTIECPEFLPKRLLFNEKWHDLV